MCGVLSIAIIKCVKLPRVKLTRAKLGKRAKLSRAKLASRCSGMRPTSPRQTSTRQKGRAKLDCNNYNTALSYVLHVVAVCGYDMGV